MSLYDWQRALALKNTDEPFYALIMAAMLKASGENMLLLRGAYPEVADEVQRRYHSRLAIETPGGKLLPGALPEDFK